LTCCRGAPAFSVAGRVTPRDRRQKSRAPRLPTRFRRRRGRKRIVAPNGSGIAPTSKPQTDGTLVKPLARAWRWQRMLDEGVYATVSEIGDAENISKGYVTSVQTAQVRLWNWVPSSMKNAPVRQISAQASMSRVCRGSTCTAHVEAVLRQRRQAER
jgi:hypothetical protein